VVPPAVTDRPRHALEHAELGQRVHPLHDGDKRPRLKGWPGAATSDLDQVDRWWTRWPNANIGIREAVEDLHSAIDALRAAHTGWHSVATEIAGYLRGMNLNPAENAPGEHGLEPIIRDLRRLRELRSPAPHWRRREATEDEQRRVAQLLRERNEVEVA
jgi:Bifunctional DNA primase/polymerase, N-terminal